MNVFWIDYNKLEIKIEKIDGDIDFDLLNQQFPDGWWETFSEAEEEFSNLLHSEDNSNYTLLEDLDEFI